MLSLFQPIQRFVHLLLHKHLLGAHDALAVQLDQPAVLLFKSSLLQPCLLHHPCRHLKLSFKPQIGVHLQFLTLIGEEELQQLLIAEGVGGVIFNLELVDCFVVDLLL